MNEKLTEEIGKITDTAKNFTDEAGKLVLDRFRNPYILTFLISWILFNWRPISYFSLSNKTIEEKIVFINDNYSDYWNCFLYPFGITMLYLFALPYLNMINEWCIKWSVKYRAEYAAGHLLNKIKNDTKIAIAEDKKQKAIAYEKESLDKVNYLKDLEEKNRLFQETLATERKTNSDLFKNLDAQNRKLSKDLLDIQKLLHDRQIHHDEEIIIERNRVEELEVSIMDIDRQKNLLQKELNEAHTRYELQNWLAERWKNSTNKLLSLGGRDIFEYFRNDEELLYFDVFDDVFISKSEVFEMFKKHTLKWNTNNDQYNAALDKVRRKLVVQNVLGNPL